MFVSILLLRLFFFYIDILSLCCLRPCLFLLCSFFLLLCLNCFRVPFTMSGQGLLQTSSLSSMHHLCSKRKEKRHVANRNILRTHQSFFFPRFLQCLCNTQLWIQELLLYCKRSHQILNASIIMWSWSQLCRLYATTWVMGWLSVWKYCRRRAFLMHLCKTLKCIKSAPLFSTEQLCQHMVTSSTDAHTSLQGGRSSSLYSV